MASFFLFTPTKLCGICVTNRTKQKHRSPVLLAIDPIFPAVSYDLKGGSLSLQCYFFTLGCKVNSCETAGMEAVFQAAGYAITQQPELADVIVLNTCTVTASGDNRMHTALRKLRACNPEAVVLLTGCYAQAYPDAAAALPEADIVTGTQNRTQLPQLVKQFLTENRRPLRQVTAYNGSEAFACLPHHTPADRTRAFLKIQDGCNCFCSYCIIPYARGRCRSMPLKNLQAEVQQLAAAGYQEVVLCGINLAFYGKEWGSSLLEAVQLCCETAGIQRVRLSSLEPERMTETVLDALAALPAFCPQFHLSLQSGCDRTLKEMHRRYNTSEYAALCHAIRKRFPVCSITTDLMVGFPGETDADFAESLAFARKMQFAKIHVFRYSPRSGTPAAERTDQIPDSVKHSRMLAMQQMEQTARTAFLQSRVGMTLPVLFERERDAAFHNGHTPDFTPVKIPAESAKKSLRKSIFYVRIEKSDSACCFGHIVPEDNANSSQKE